jgi:transcription elongation GreA/GreB family factor
MSERVDLPTPTIGTDDYNSLKYAATIALQQGSPHADFLITELHRARLCRPDDLPADVISTGSRVTYRLHGPESVTCILVGPENAARSPGEVSVMTPLGIALLGLRAGDRMPFRTGKDGPVSEVIVDAVDFVPSPTSHRTAPMPASVHGD